MDGQVRTAVILGEQSLLVQCGELLLNQGFNIEAVVSKNPVVKDWCEEKNLQYFSAFNDLQGKFAEASVDYVFSITNLLVLPDWLIQLGKQAINFHDGPLPKYAGLNAPVWAILNNEPEHGISWHEMTSKVDEGRVLVQQIFPIIPGETALSINAKCYQAGLESFGKLVEGLITGNLTPIQQDLSQRSYFGLSKRPEAAGLIDWNAPIDDTERLVRALDHGTYANPLVTAKLIFGDELIAVKSAKIVQRTTDQNPGTIVETHTNYLRVAVNGGVIELSDFWSLSGESYPCVQGMMNKHGLSLGAQLASIGDEVKEQISARLEETSRYEGSWLNALKNAEAISIPYASKIPSDAQAKLASTWSVKEYSLPASVLSLEAFQQSPKAYKVALLSVLLGRLNNKSSFTFSVCAEESQALAPFFASNLPLPVEVDDSGDIASLISATSEGLVNFEKCGTFPSDVWLRYPALEGHGALDTFGVKLAFGIAPDEVALSNTELLACIDDEGADISFYYCRDVLTEESIEQLCAQLSAVATDVSVNPERAIRDISILSEQDKQSTKVWNATEQEYDSAQCLHQLIEQQALATPMGVAVAFENEEVDYQGLNARANQVARLLAERGAKSGDLIGLMMDRSIDMVVTLIAIHKVGCAYVPLDPVYPADRLRYMVEDSKLSILVTESRHKTKLGDLKAQLIVHDELESAFGSYSTDNLEQPVNSSHLAYVIYTSGSTGKPKGVMVEHRNVVNFFVGMDQCIGTEKGTWLAVTSISFDISVLELFWTLARGFKVVLYSDKIVKGEQVEQTSAPLGLDIDFSLFYWNVADEESHYKQNKYDLLLDGARFADQNGFKAVWNPERHFASFGGLFPNPAVTLAGLATITKNVDLRAGSCVIPLHSPIRVAEEWAVVDNFSNGRVGIAVASGWAPPDFAIKPENFPDAKNIMFESLDKVRKLWRGEKVTFPGPTGDVEVRTLPRPIQAELPYWVTTAGNVDTFRRAGEAGANVLTHLLGQTFEEVKEKVDAYREAWKAAGHEGEGTITLMLHTFIGESMEQVEDAVRIPMKNYLRSAMFLVKGAAWNFPTFKKMSDETGKSLDEFFETISDEDMDDLLEFAFQRYFRTSGLFGTPETAKETVAKCHEIGVNEIACLIDYGIDTDVVLKHLPYLNELKNNAVNKAEVVANASSNDFTIPALIEKHGVTHFQCTPSMATMLVSDPESKASLKQVQHMMVGGEALPTSLGDALTDAIGGRLTNMYGPTETTIWSSTFDVENGKEISIGRPISNTQIHIVDQNLKPLPVGVAGELVIGGDGVVRGYHERPELTAERFVDSFKQTTDSQTERVYRTGDLAKYAEDGRLIYLGRIDHQVKIRGYRIELGEIESLLQAHDSVRECAVILREDKVGDKRLVAYVRPHFEQHVEAEALKQHLAAQLPEFMVPAYYVELATMPLTPNGKLDRNALPEPLQQRHEGSEEFALPENEWESLIAEIWKNALGVPEVGRKDNFFDIGGHSLLVIQVLKDLREHDKVTKSIQMTDLFRHTTIEALAKFVASDENEATGTKAASSRVAARKAAMSRRRRR